jgi:hypothetical protein
MCEAARNQLDKKNASQAKERDLKHQIRAQKRQTKEDDDVLQSMQDQIDDVQAEMRLAYGHAKAFHVLAKNITNALLLCCRATDDYEYR